MTRMIERWFPSSDVSASSIAGWGSGNAERQVFTWFAARPTAQAKAAVICSLLEWPDETHEQERLQALVHAAMTGRFAAWDELRREIAISNPAGASVLDSFSGRGMIPLEAARLGVESFAVDYSPVATLASHLLTDYPYRNWAGEPVLPFEANAAPELVEMTPRILRDVETVLEEIGRRWSKSMAEYYPAVDGRIPWGYLWAVTLPCQECGRRFPLVGKYDLRPPSKKPGNSRRPERVDPGQSFYIEPTESGSGFRAVVHDGLPRHQPTLLNAVVDGRKVAGKSARCIFCSHVHPLAVHRRLTDQGEGKDALLVVADLDDTYGKSYRAPTNAEIEAAEKAGEALGKESDFTPFLPAVPDERIAAGNNNIIGPSIYGARTYGDLMGDRQTLSYVRLARVSLEVSDECEQAGLSAAYVGALMSYVAATVVRRLRYSTRSAWLHHNRQCVAGIFINEGSLSFSYDFFETGIGDGPSTWAASSAGTLSSLKGLFTDKSVRPTRVSQGSAVAVELPSESVAAVVTDPPYDEMIAYSDSSDLFYAWLKRFLFRAIPEFAITADTNGCQDKQQEIIVKRVRGEAPDEHRTRDHYDRLLAQAFREMARVVRTDGVVSIVFGHGEPEVWKRLLSSIQQAGLVMTGSWPANTESGGRQGKANIQTTLTMACRRAPEGRPPGRKGAVESEIKEVIRARYPDWERWGLAPADMLMAAAGPAMEVVGRYSEVLDAKGNQVDISTFLPLARGAVQDAMAVEINHQPLETFDARTRFALWWVRLYGRQVQAKSELRWQALAASLELSAVRDLVSDSEKGVRFISALQFKGKLDADSAVIDVALALAAASEDGLEAMGSVLVSSQRNADDTYLWAAVQFLADRLPDNDSDSIAFTRVLRTKKGIGSAAENIAADEQEKQRRQRQDNAQLRLI